MTSDKTRFEAQFTPEPYSGCWLWTASTTRDGYGQIRLNGKSIKAHRASWKLYRGDIPHGSYVLHHCDVKTCVNPEHLFLGSQADNILDAYLKGRLKTPIQRALGERHGSAKLTDAQVLAIRKDTRPDRAIAADYGITSENVSCIQRRKTWKHLEVQS